MARILRRTRAVLRKFDSEQEFWHDAWIVVKGDRIILETHWRNPELAGIWLCTYEVLWKCFVELKNQGLIEIHDEMPGKTRYRLSEEGRKRLG